MQKLDVRFSDFGTGASLDGLERHLLNDRSVHVRFISALLDSCPRHHVCNAGSGMCPIQGRR